MTDSGCLTVGTLNLGSNQSDHDGGEWWKNPSKILDISIRKHKTFYECSGVQWTCCLTITIRYFFILSVRSGLLAALPQGKPESYWRWSCIVQNETFWSSSGCKVFISSADSWGFFLISLCKKVSVACEALLLLLPLNLCFGTALLGSPLAEDKSFIMVDLALPLRLHIIFIGIFSLLQARIRAFLSLLLHFPFMLKWYFQK